MRQKKIERAIVYGIGGFMLGFVLTIFISFPVAKTVEIFPFLLGEEKSDMRYCFHTSKNQMSCSEIIHCSDVEMRIDWISAGMTVAILFAVFGFFEGDFYFSKEEVAVEERIEREDQKPKEDEEKNME